MQSITLRMLLLCVGVTMLCPMDGYARRSDRNGFNFGTTLVIGSAETQRLGAAAPIYGEEERFVQQGVRPYVGYAFEEVFNLGLMGTVDQSSKATIFPENGENVKIQQNASLQGMSLFTRFLFGRILFFGASVGVFEQTLGVTRQWEVQGADGGFSGRRESNSLRTVGTGYGFSGGIEVPISYGFYFTGNYTVESYRMKQVGENNQVGSKVENQQKQGVAFGLSYFAD